MCCGLMQLVAIGTQDEYLTIKPEVTMFKATYKRHTHFGMARCNQTLLGGVGFGKRFTVQIERKADLIHGVMLEINLPKLDVTNAKLAADAANVGYRSPGWVNWIGHRIVKHVSLEIGGVTIVEYDSNYAWSWDQITQDTSDGYRIMVGMDGASLNDGGTLYVPLHFFFTDNPGLALPIIALQYHQVSIHVTLRDFSELIHGHGAGIVTTLADPAVGIEEVRENGTIQVIGQLQCRLYVDYIYLESSERKRFAQKSHEYLIQQIQSTDVCSFTGCNTKIDLDFQHPCKELILVVNRHEDNNWNWYNFIESKSVALSLNNTQICKREGSYLTLVEPWKYHSHVPENHNVHVLSFSLTPETHQPSGSINLSRIDNAVLSISMDTTGMYDVTVYARNYNVLNIRHGLAGLEFAS